MFVWRMYMGFNTKVENGVSLEHYQSTLDCPKDRKRGVSVRS